MSTVYFPRATSGGPATVTDKVALRAVAVATTSYVASDAVLVAGFNKVVFHLAIVKGDATTFQFKAEGSADNGTTWEPLTYRAVQSAGVTEVTKDPMNVTASGLDATSETLPLPPCDCAGFSLARMSVKYTGGTGTGTVGISASGSVMAVA